MREFSDTWLAGSSSRQARQRDGHLTGELQETAGAESHRQQRGSTKDVDRPIKIPARMLAVGLPQAFTKPRPRGTALTTRMRVHLQELRARILDTSKE
jgi:hypothetical protein